MNFKANETSQKLRGGFYTGRGIADFLVRWVSAASPKTILEPSCGDGAFFASLKALTPRAKVTACELDQDEAAKARANAHRNTSVIEADFLRWYLTRPIGDQKFDAVVGNPPFIRYQYLPEEQQRLAERIFSRFGLPFTKHTNAWVPFVIASIDLLRPGGRLAMVIPSEIFHIPHAQSLRTMLAARCGRVLLVDPQELWFEDALQGTVLLLAEKEVGTTPHKGVGVAQVTGNEFLSAAAEPLFEKTLFSNGETTQGKWMRLFLTQEERDLVAAVKQRPNVKPFADVASVDVGIVTGANKFFLVPDEIVEKHGLQRWAHPMFGRSEHVQGIVFNKRDLTANKKSGLPANFIWIEEPESALPAAVRNYLKLGEAQKLHKRYKCSIREPWYTVPSVYAAPVAMLKRAHHFPRLVLNKAGAFTTDTAYLIRPKTGVQPEDLVFSFVNSLTLLTAELEGRHYGGGVMELVPSEIERLVVPIVQGGTAHLAEADRRFRDVSDDETFVSAQDAVILSSLGLTRGDRQRLHGAWNKLRLRRLREDAPSSDQVDD